MLFTWVARVLSAVLEKTVIKDNSSLTRSVTFIWLYMFFNTGEIYRQPILLFGGQSVKVFFQPADQQQTQQKLG